jgi:hypothetical protein
MPYRRSAYAGLALVAMIGLTGCNPTDDQSAPARSGASQPAGTPEVSAAEAALSADARDELATAAARLADDTVRVHVSVAGQMSMTGVIDPRSQDASMRVDMGQVDDGTQAEIRKLGPDVWVRLKGPVGTLIGADDQWLHLEAADLPETSTFNVITGDDPLGVRATVDAVTEVKRTGTGSFAGLVDLTRTPRYSKQTLSALGAKASAVPFTARIDGQGRLIELTTELSALVSGAGTATTRFSDFGVPVEVERPPADETTEAPSDLRSVLDV